jgi:uncharacterized protein
MDDGVAGVVIDTNVVLDWLVFADADASTLGQAVEASRVCWWSCPAMRSEVAHMVSHPDLRRWAPDAPAVLATCDRLARWSPEPPAAPPGLRCRDPDDQVFIDLAIQRKARWLVTRDRALLALARRARLQGLLIVKPAGWAA